MLKYYIFIDNKYKYIYIGGSLDSCITLATVISGAKNDSSRFSLYMN